MKRIALVLGVLTFVIFGASALCSAQQNDASSIEDNKVHIEIMPYLLVPGMGGQVSLKGTTQSINASAGDILSHLQLGFMARTKLSYNRWFAGTDTLYMGLGGANDLVDAGFDQWAAELIGGYQVNRRIALLGGVRYNSLSTNIQFKGPLGPNPRGSQVWWDPFFGGMGTFPLKKKVNFSARLDVGGFNAGSRIAVNAEPLLNYQINSHLTGSIGWKFFYQDYINTGQAFEYDVLTQGLLVGMRMRW